MSGITAMVGIWSCGKRVYILRKHPGISLLDSNERGKGTDNVEEKNGEDEGVDRDDDKSSVV